MQFPTQNIAEYVNYTRRVAHKSLPRLKTDAYGMRKRNRRSTYVQSRLKNLQGHSRDERESTKCVKTDKENTPEFLKYKCTRLHQQKQDKMAPVPSLPSREPLKSISVESAQVPDVSMSTFDALIFLVAWTYNS